MTIRDQSVSDHESGYRWLILLMVSLTGFIGVGFQSTTLSVLFSEISESLGLDLLQIGVIWGMGSFMGIFTSLVAGPIIDHVGTRRAVVTMSLLVGVFGAMRGLATDFWTLLLFSFLLGTVQPALPINLIKLNLQWFAPRQLGLASGIMSFGFAVGLMLGARLGASELSPAVGGWRNVMFVMGIGSVVLGVLWALVHPSEAPKSDTPFDWSLFFEKLRQVAQVRNLWILGFVGFGVTGLMRGVVGYAPSYLREIGWAGVDADTATSLFFLASLTGVIPLSYLSDRLQNRRALMLFATCTMTTGTIIMFFADGVTVWVFAAMLIGGFAFDTFMALQNLSISRLAGVPMALAGSAVGFGNMIRNTGNTFSPLIGNSLASRGLNLPFLVWAGFGMMAVVLLLFYEENARPDTE